MCIYKTVFIQMLPLRVYLVPGKWNLMGSAASGDVGEHAESMVRAGEEAEIEAELTVCGTSWCPHLQPES